MRGVEELGDTSSGVVKGRSPRFVWRCGEGVEILCFMGECITYYIG